MLPYIGIADVLRRSGGASRKLLLSARTGLDYFVRVFRTGVMLVNEFIDRSHRSSIPQKNFHPQVICPPVVPQTTAILAEPRLNSFLSLGPRGFHRVAYTEWGDPANPRIVMCVHGFARNSRDFDFLAARLAEKFRVVCMDVVGRGASDWLEHKEDYDFSLYLSDAAALLARVMTPALPERNNGNGIMVPNEYEPSIDWIGTSMGGLIGMLIAAKPNTFVRRLVLNDVGPLVPWAGLARLRNLHSKYARFRDLFQVEAHLRDICASFGPLTDEHWQHVARHGARQLESGDYVLTYDPGIMSGMGHARHGIEFGVGLLSGVDLWPVWDKVKCPTLVLRGGSSDLLPRSVSDRMTRRGPGARIVEFPGVGHAPWLMSSDQIEIVREFLIEPQE